MKDIQGIHRGKCNTCECEEYRAPPTPGQLRCEYCNHTPGEHVRIVELGACKQCGKDNCDKYVSEDPNSYTDCQYCGCAANQHVGADALRRPQPQRSQFGGGGGGGAVPITAVLTQQPGGIQPRVSEQGSPQQTTAFGTCSRPGCPYPKRIDGDKVHDYCSRTCAQKDMQGGASGFQQKVVTVRHFAGAPGMPSSSFSHQQGQVPPTSQPQDPKAQTGSFPPSGAPPTGASPTGASPTSGPSGTPLCRKCNKRYANPGRGWCQQCYLESQSP